MEGRLLSRVTFLPDGTISHLAIAYGPGSEKVTMEQDVDERRVPLRRVREQTDRRGRPVEREEMTLQGTRQVTRRTKFKYDAKGRQTAETQIIE